jgi:hypothetical protein
MSVTMAGRMCAVMQPATWMTDPSWFLVTGLPWPGDQTDTEVAEAAFAIAPPVTQVVRPLGPEGEAVPLGNDLALMLDVGSRCAAARGKRVIFLSDITSWLADLGLNWERVGVDFPTAQDELEQQSLGLFVKVSRKAYTILCSTAPHVTICYTSGRKAEIPPEERELVRASFEVRLRADWPRYVTKALVNAPPAA